ncbi:hypothetical protein GOODEAATRI_002238, partial [Goodea atripinnis]
YIPEIDEPSLSKEDVNLGTTPVRKQLFTGKTFVFLTNKQLKRLSAAVGFGGGRSLLLEEGSLPLNLLESPHSCVVEVTTGSSQNLFPPSATEWANSVKNSVHRTEVCNVTGVAAVGETPEKKQNRNAAGLPGSKPVTEKTTTESIVEDTMSSSLSAADSTDPRRRKPDPSLKGGITKEDESSAVMSAPKRPAPEPSITSSQDTHSPRVSKKMPSLSPVGPPAVSETPLDSGDDLYAGRAEVLAEEPGSRKRKGMEEEIKLEELESIMSEDMDYLDDELPSSYGQKQPLMLHGLAKQKQGSHTESSSKKQRVHQEQAEITRQRPDLGLEKERSEQNHREQSEWHVVSIKTEQVDLTVSTTPNHDSSKPPNRSAASATKEKKAFEDDEASFIEVSFTLKVIHFTNAKLLASFCSFTSIFVSFYCSCRM